MVYPEAKCIGCNKGYSLTLCQCVCNVGLAKTKISVSVDVTTGMLTHTEPGTHHFLHVHVEFGDGVVPLGDGVLQASLVLTQRRQQQVLGHLPLALHQR